MSAKCGFFLLNDVRFGEKKLPRMIDRCAMLALPRGAEQPPDWPLPELSVLATEIAAWRARRGLTEDRPVVALAPGAVGPSKRWTDRRFCRARSALNRRRRCGVGSGRPERESRRRAKSPPTGGARDLTGTDLRDAILALAAASVAVSNDSGLLHVAAAAGTPSIGIFGPTSPWHWAPLNPLAAVIETATALPCRPCHKPVCRLAHHRCMRDIAPDQVLAAAREALAKGDPS